MTDILIQGADTLITMDDTRREIAGADLRMRDGVIIEIGQGFAG